MSYAGRETSVQDGEPVELIDIYADAEVWHVTPNKGGYTFDDVVYEEWPIEHDPIESTWEEVRNSISMRVPREFPVVDQFRIIYPTAIIEMVIRETHRGDSEAAVRWDGRISGIREMSGASAVFACDPDSVSMDREGPSVIIQIPCRAQLFDEDCGLDPLDWRHLTTVVDVDGLFLTVASITALPFAGGEVLWVDDNGNTNSRAIEAADGTLLKLTRPFYGIPVGAAVDIRPQCPKDIGTCDTVYNNKLRHRGNPHLTTVNPMDGRQVF